MCLCEYKARACGLFFTEIICIRIPSLNVPYISQFILSTSCINLGNRAVDSNDSVC